jgi:integrase
MAQRAAVRLMDQEHPRNEKPTLPSSVHSKPINFQDFATDWISTNALQWKNQKHTAQWTYTLQHFAFPKIGGKPLNTLDTNDILSVLEPIWHSKTETASRLRGRMERILAAAKVKGLADSNPALWKGHLDAVLPSPGAIKRAKGVRHHRALHYLDIPEFMKNLREMNGVGALALEFTILTACRTNEVLGAIRSEISGDIWTVPAARMKSGRDHRVPIGTRLSELLRISMNTNDDSQYLFANGKGKLSNMAMSTVLRRMNIDCTVHGFRSTFRDWVSECTGWSAETAEMALAHTIKNKVEAAYRRGDLLEQRRRLLIDWERYCGHGGDTRQDQPSRTPNPRTT